MPCFERAYADEENPFWGAVWHVLSPIMGLHDLEFDPLTFILEVNLYIIKVKTFKTYLVDTHKDTKSNCGWHRFAFHMDNFIN